MDTTQINAILDPLNNYDGSSIWQDVILHLDGYDEDATVALDPSDSSDVAMIGGEVFRWDGSRHAGARWVRAKD